MKTWVESQKLGKFIMSQTMVIGKKFKQTITVTENFFILDRQEKA